MMVYIFIFDVNVVPWFTYRIYVDVDWGVGWGLNPPSLTPLDLGCNILLYICML